MADPSKRFVDVEITKEAPKISAAGFGGLMVITDSVKLTPNNRTRSFYTVAAVADFFGENSEEHLAADAFFFQDPFLDSQPEVIHFGRYVDAASAAVIECGDNPEKDVSVWAAVTDGAFNITVDGTEVTPSGMNFSSATTLADVATVLSTASPEWNCTYSGGRFVFYSSTTGAASTISILTPGAIGTDISGEDFLAGAVEASPSTPGGSILSQGMVAEAAAGVVGLLEASYPDWASLSALKKFRDGDDAKAFSDSIESRKKIFVLASNDMNTFVTGNTSNISYITKAKGYKRTAFPGYDNAARYPDMAWLGQQLPKPIGSTNWAYKTLAGKAQGAMFDIPPMTLTEEQISAALSVNCNVYTETMAAAFMYFGTMAGGRNADNDGEYIDIIRNIDFLQARVTEGLLSLFVELDIIPFTDGGITIADGRLKSLLQQFGVEQKILSDGTVNTFFPKRSSVASEDREGRLLPDGTFDGELRGAMNTIQVRGKVRV